MIAHHHQHHYRLYNYYYSYRLTFIVELFIIIELIGTLPFYDKHNLNDDGGDDDDDSYDGIRMNSKQNSRVG